MIFIQQQVLTMPLNTIYELNLKNMKKIIILVVSLVVVAGLFFLLNRQEVNMCGHTMEEANNPIHWHNGVYAPVGCNIN